MVIYANKFSSNDPAKSENNINNYVDAVTKAIIKSFESGHDMLMVSHIIPDWAQKHSKFGVPAVNYRNNVAYRSSLTTSEFAIIFKALKKHIFESPLQYGRKEKLRNKLKRILVLKAESCKLVRHKQVKSAEQYYQKITDFKHMEITRELFKKSFTIFEPSSGSASLAHLKEKDKLLVFFPTEFTNYNDIKTIQKNNYRRVLKNAKAWVFANAIYKEFRDTTDVKFYMDKWLVNYSEIHDRAQEVKEIRFFSRLVVGKSLYDLQ